jgi:DNA-binding GntR family transcriptional regulator
VERLTPADLQSLEVIISEMHTAARLGDFTRLIDCDYQFHTYVVHAAGHELLEEMWRNTHAKVRVYLAATGLMHASMKSIAKSHTLILDVLRTRDAKRVRDAMVQHIEDVFEPFLKTVLRAGPVTAPPGDTNQSGSAR